MSRVHFGIFFQGVNHSTIWNSPQSGSQVDFESFKQIVATAERGLFDAFFLGEGLRLREQNGHLLDLDVVGRPDAITQLAALAGITRHIGLVATQNVTYNEPVDLARRLGGLDLLSGGRVGWNVVTTDNAWTGENFRRGGYLDHELRYVRAADFVEAAKAIWAAETGQAVQLASTTVNANVVSTAPVQRLSPQGGPVLFQAGDSAQGRKFGGTYADVIFSAHGQQLDDALSFAREIRGHAQAAGRPEGAVRILPGAEVILAATEAEVKEKAHWVRHSQISGATALALVAQVWGRELDDLDPDGPLPQDDPPDEVTDGSRGSGFQGIARREKAREYRRLAEENNWSIRDIAINTARRSLWVGTPAQVAERLIGFVDAGAIDGLNLTPYLVPGGLDDVVNLLIPELQERGYYPAGYESSTLREHLELPPVPALTTV